MLPLSLFSQLALAISAIHIQADSIEAPAGSIKNAQFQVSLKGTEPSLKLQAQVKPANEKEFIPFDLSCGHFQTEEIGKIDCIDGNFTAKQIKAPFAMRLFMRSGKALAHNSEPDLSANILFSHVNFSDASGLHAGENLAGQLKFEATHINDTWHWNGLFSWVEGELLWQPFYFGKAGNKLEVKGTFKQPMLRVQDANLLVNGVGSMDATAAINTQTKAVEDIHVDAKDVDFAGLYATFLKPLAEKSVFGDLAVTGKADWRFEFEHLEPKRFNLNLREASIDDHHGKFAFYGIDAHLPWDYDNAQTMMLSYNRGHLLKVPLGKAKLSAEINRYSLIASKLSLPVLDGVLNFYDVSAAMIDKQWYWHLRMDLTPISMNGFSKALGWPEMRGQILGKIPMITYANKQLDMDGAMTFSVFNGMIGMDNLKIDDPLGVAPKLNADLLMRGLDLGELTRTFSFGNIEGKLDGDVKNMRLENWKPVYMDAMIQTSEGKHVKKISQRAVENITALGGEGTAAALQRTFLHFFKEFNYDKIGLSCKLRQDVCEMGGVESTPTGFVIVKGKGIPSVNVNGYTQKVSLEDLLARIKRITDGNSKMIVK
ncbi:MAG: hypothetical protein HOP21_12575 [Methylotenera sp.]|nr:hypothetical protein [Methylotenera sp.]